MKLNKEEKKFLDAYEKGVYEPVRDPKNEIARYREYAKSALKKNKRINIRVSERDILHIQRKAVEEGLPYQTLISSILHKYVSREIWCSRERGPGKGEY